MLRGLGQMKKYPVFFERERTLLTCCNYVSPSLLALTGYTMCHRQNVMKRLQFPCATAASEASGAHEEIETANWCHRRSFTIEICKWWDGFSSHLQLFCETGRYPRSVSIWMSLSLSVCDCFDPNTKYLFFWCPLLHTGRSCTNQNANIRRATKCQLKIVPSAEEICIWDIKIHNLLSDRRQERDRSASNI